MVVAPFNFLGLAAPDLRRRAGLLGVSKAKGVTSEGESAVLEGLRVVATGRAALLSAGCASTGLAADLVVDLLVDLEADWAATLAAVLLVSSVARLVAGIQELLSILQRQPYSLTIWP